MGKIVRLFWVCIAIAVYAESYRLFPESDLVGSLQSHRIEHTDTWQSLAYRYDVGYDEIRSANSSIVNLSQHVGSILIIPTLHILPPKEMRQGIVVNLAEKRLYYFSKDKKWVYTYPVSIGKAGWKTPQFQGRVVRKKIAPSWNVPQSIKNYYIKKYQRQLPDVVPPGPKNP